MLWEPVMPSGMIRSSRHACRSCAPASLPASKVCTRFPSPSPWAAGTFSRCPVNGICRCSISAGMMCRRLRVHSAWASADRFILTGLAIFGNAHRASVCGRSRLIPYTPHSLRIRRRLNASGWAIKGAVSKNTMGETRLALRISQRSSNCAQASSSSPMSFAVCAMRTRAPGDKASISGEIR